jgi:hypothetical protein
MCKKKENYKPTKSFFQSFLPNVQLPRRVEELLLTINLTRALTSGFQG